MAWLSRADRDAVVLHAAFLAISLLVLLMPLGLATGWRILALVILYNAALPLLAWRRGHAEWLSIWAFLAPLSVVQIFPDWFLTAQLNILAFPDTGAPFIGAVPLFMAGLWTIALFPLVWIGRRVQAERGRLLALIAVAAAALVMFLAAEATFWMVPVWYAQNVQMVAQVAVYVLPPEILLSLAAFIAYDATRERALALRLSAAFAVMLFYLGGLCFFYFVVEKL
jgi:hypothetical protein